ncbi:MAG: universal stress protein [Vicinamibacterales bacterium]
MTLRGPVFVGTDLSSAASEALRQAQALARDLSSSMIVCHVLPEFPAVRMLFPQWAGVDAAKQEAMASTAEKAVRRQVAETIGDATHARVVLDTGTPHAGLLAQAEAAGAGIIVTGPGRVADRVVRHATVPVLVARPSPRGDVIGATDFSDPSLPALETAAFEARRRTSRLRVVHVIDIGVSALAGGAGAGAPFLGAASLIALESIDELKTAARDRLQQMLAGSGVDGEAVAVSGSAATTLIGIAESSRAELVVVGTHGRSGLARLTLGSTAEAVVDSAPCSVLVVRLAHT